MNINISRANIYLVDDCDFVVAVSEEQAVEWASKQYGDEYTESSAQLIDGSTKYFVDEDIEITNDQKIEYLEINAGKRREQHKAVKTDDCEIALDKNFTFYGRRTLQEQLLVETANGILFHVPFLLASTEY